MNKKMIAAVMAGAALSMAASAASAGTLTNVSVTLSDNRVSRPTDVTIRYTTEMALIGGNYILVTHEFGGLTRVAGACGSDVTVTINGTPLLSNDMQDCRFAANGWFQIRRDRQCPPTQKS